MQVTIAERRQQAVNSEKLRRDKHFRFANRFLNRFVDGRLSRTGYLICQLVLEYTALGRPCWVSTAYLARSLRVSEKTVANELTKLRSDGYILRRRRNGVRYLEARIPRGRPRNPDGWEHKRDPEKRPELLGLVSASLKKEKAGHAEAVSGSPLKTFRDDGASDDRKTAVEQSRVTAFKRPLEKPSNKKMDKIPFPSSPHDKRPRCAVEPWDSVLWSKIKAFCVQQRTAPSRNRRLQAEAVAITRRRLAVIGIGSEEIERVWDWYASHYGTAGMRLPLVTNAAQLYDRWAWITDKMKAAQKQAPPPVELPPQVEEVLRDLHELQWPAGSETQLPAVVLASYNTLVAFRSSLVAASKTSRGIQIQQELKMVYGLIGEPIHYLSTWFKTFWQRIREWDGWSGNLAQAEWTPDSQQFSRAVNSIFSSYGSGLKWSQVWSTVVNLSGGKNA